MPDEHLQMLAEAFVLGALTQAETEAFAQRLAQGEQSAVQALAEARRLMLALPFALPQQMPPAELKQNILNTIAAEKKQAPMKTTPQPQASVRALPQRTFRQSMMRSFAWAAVFLLFAVGYGYINQQKRIAELLAENTGLKQQLAFHVQVQRTLQKSKRLMIVLNTTKAGETATATALVDQEQAEGFFFTDKLPALPANQDYQLWYIGNAGPVDAGIFQVDASGYSALTIRNLPQNVAEISAFAVTIEPKGGSASPTLDQMVLLGKIG